MKKESVDSSAVERVGYDPEGQILEVEFKGGRVYQYFEVPNSVYEALMQAESMGRFVNQNIVGAYEFTQL